MTELCIGQAEAAAVRNVKYSRRKRETESDAFEQLSSSVAQKGKGGEKKRRRRLVEGGAARFSFVFSRNGSLVSRF